MSKDDFANDIPPDKIKYRCDAGTAGILSGLALTWITQYLLQVRYDCLMDGEIGRG